MNNRLVEWLCGVMGTAPEPRSRGMQTSLEDAFLGQYSLSRQGGQWDVGVNSSSGIRLDSVMRSDQSKAPWHCSPFIPGIRTQLPKFGNGNESRSPPTSGSLKTILPKSGSVLGTSPPGCKQSPNQPKLDRRMDGNLALLRRTRSAWYRA